MIHEITENILNINLDKLKEFDILVFDDGLYSQFKNYKHFLKLNKPLYFAITTSIICNEDIIQNENVEPCHIAHEKAFKGNFEDYMKLSQIKEIYNNKNCFITGHNHYHKVYKDIKGAKNDFIMMNEFFKNNNIKIDSYCFPYNNENSMTSIFLKKYNKVFGKNRTPIERFI